MRGNRANREEGETERERERIREGERQQQWREKAALVGGRRWRGLVLTVYLN
jgi:hypothetical protein